MSKWWPPLLTAVAFCGACGSDEPSTPTGGGGGQGVGASGVGASGAATTSSGGSGGGVGGTGGSPVAPSPCTLPDPPADALYVATDGDDTTGDGSLGAPWATIDHALDNATDGDVILVRPGEYNGRVRLEGTFANGVTVRSEVLYAARLRNTEVVVTALGAEGITLEGFDIAHAGAGAGGLVVQIANVGTSRITIRNNVLHDSFNNDILKINNGAEDVLVERNLFYNQQGSDEHIDVNSVRDVVVQDNVFVNDFAASGRTNDNSTSSYIVIKDSNGNSDGVLGAERVDVRRNVFANWEGNTGQHFVRIGEDGTANFEATAVTVENNLMLGTSSNVFRAAFGCYGSSDVTFRNNTVVGDLPGLAFAMRMAAVGSNMPNTNIRFHNNIWSDPTGTMEDFSDTPPGETTGLAFDNNVFFNGGSALPEDGNESVNPSDDANAIVGDPQLGDPASAQIPTWDESAMMFTDGSATVCDAHARLVSEHGVPGATSVALDAADAANAPADDILGRPRAGASDCGAVEVP